MLGLSFAAHARHVVSVNITRDRKQGILDYLVLRLVCYVHVKMYAYCIGGWTLFFP